uniref:Uncharacterized protein n=1 Tax=Daphnia galeata TaxID=27404 RepID=A0A8J2RFK2_9CRUS|nr:unnamed protein product [Daphnia galeata]
MKLIVFAMVLALLAAASCSEYQPTLPALNEDEAHSKPASSTSSEESDEDDSDEEKIVHQPPIASYNAPAVVSYAQQIEYKIPYVVPPTAAPEYVAPVSSDYDPLTILPYWLRPRTY